MTEDQEKLAKAYFSAFNSPEGALVLNDLKNQFYRGTSLDDTADPNRIIISEGKRFVVIHILSQIELITQKAED